MYRKIVEDIFDSFLHGIILKLNLFFILENLS